MQDSLPCQKNKILLVDDDRIILKAVSKLISQRLSLPVITAENLSDTQTWLEKERQNIGLAVCDYHLPDAEKGEATLVKRIVSPYKISLQTFASIRIKQT
ncbi:response regulator [Thermodesulfobacterium hveragerdense]|uniref:response regulator n=1 Tax=Thermodesulfobacterium hveragerdense TaxID=53424 RepID=UPI000415E504|nr:response regulator [Thermodesulfobacterium hveragerdense]